mmetsp:Transcript_28655/g.54869  ORF Transcript_28655/g.54869 Transcript_28655/m.54869 type:complete len:282 (+) Transcript_28655:401-1246(+)
MFSVCELNMYKGRLLTYCACMQFVGSTICGRKGQADNVVCPLVALSDGLRKQMVKKPLQIPQPVGSGFQGVGNESLGTCAVVGLSASLLSCFDGSSIDSSNTVFRMGFSPLKNFAKHVGMKSSYTLCRSMACTRPDLRAMQDIYGFPHMPAEYEDAKLILPSSSRRKCQHKDNVVFWDRTKNSMELLAEYLNHTGLLSPTTGFSFVIDLLASGICLKIHVYGMGGRLGRYSHFVTEGGSPTHKQMKLRGQRMKRNHSPDVELNVYYRLMASGYPVKVHVCG